MVNKKMEVYFMAKEKEHMNLAFIGHVDHGKSTLVGHLLLQSGVIAEQQLAKGEDKFRFDVWYVDHWSLYFDVKILLLTIWKVITREGISQPGYATSEEFLGEKITKKSANH